MGWLQPDEDKNHKSSRSEAVFIRAEEVCSLKSLWFWEEVQRFTSKMEKAFILSSQSSDLHILLCFYCIFQDQT